MPVRQACGKHYLPVLITTVILILPTWMLHLKSFLRAAYTPELDENKFPPTLQVRSVHNTPIEGLWHWFLQTFGINIKDTIRHGFEIGIYNPNNDIHPYVWVVLHLPNFPCSFTIYLLEDNYFIGYGQKYYKINLTNLLNTGITTRSALRLRSLTCQARPQGMGLLFLLHPLKIAE